MPDWEFYYENGKFFFRKGDDYEKALNFFNTALTTNPRHPDCLYHKGMCLIKLGMPDEAFEIISQAFSISRHLQINYDNPDLLLTVCLLLEEHEDYKNALSLCNNAIPRFPSNTEFFKLRSQLQDRLGLPKINEIEPIQSLIPKITLPTYEPPKHVLSPKPVESINKPAMNKIHHLEKPSQKNFIKIPKSAMVVDHTIPAVNITKSIPVNQNPLRSSKIVTRDQEQDYSEEIQSLGKYYAFYSPKHDEFSANIWLLKIIDDHNEKGIDLKNPDIMHKQIEEFSEKIIQLLDPDPELVICVMPKSRKAREPGGIRQVAEKVCEKNYINGTKVIERTKDRPPYHLSGNRDYAKELASLGITNTELIKGRTILLLDDVTTEGTSLKAAKELLLSHGAKQVIPFALGKTSK